MKKLQLVCWMLFISAGIFSQGMIVNDGGGNNRFQKLGMMWVGNSPSGTYVSYDNNEIQARSGTNASRLYLNFWGGPIDLLGSSNSTGDLNVDGSGLFYDNSTNRVGIGTSFPSHRLHVAGNAKINSYLTFEGYNFFSGSDDGVIESNPAKAGSDMFYAAQDAHIFMINRNNSTTDVGTFEIWDGPTNDILFSVNDDGLANLNETGLMIVQPGGASDKNGITYQNSPTSSKWRTQHSGIFFSFYLDNVRQAYVDTDGDWIKTSDATLKENIAPMTDILSKVNLLNPVKYDYINSTSEKQDIGFLAQEVQELFPEAVTAREDGKLGIAYDHFAVIAIQAIKEQQAQIDQLQAQVTALLEK